MDVRVKELFTARTRNFEETDLCRREQKKDNIKEDVTK
jgi:hypothetical protein